VLKFIPDFRNLNVTDFFTRAITEIFPYLTSVQFQPSNSFEEDWVSLKLFGNYENLTKLDLSSLDLSEHYEKVHTLIKRKAGTLTSLNLNQTILKMNQVIEIVDLLTETGIIKELSIM
jgi:hypothetical protein